MKLMYIQSCKPQFYYIKVGFKGAKIIQACFRDDLQRFYHRQSEFKSKYSIGLKYFCSRISLGKHAYSNILKILPPKNVKKSDKNSDIFYISAQNIDCGYSLEPPRRGGSNEYPHADAVLTSTHNLCF